MTVHWVLFLSALCLRPYLSGGGKSKGAGWRRSLQDDIAGAVEHGVMACHMPASGREVFLWRGPGGAAAVLAPRSREAWVVELMALVMQVAFGLLWIEHGNLREAHWIVWGWSGVQKVCLGCRLHRCPAKEGRGDQALYNQLGVVCWMMSWLG